MIPFGLWWGSGDDRNVPLQEGDLVGDDALERLADVDVEVPFGIKAHLPVAAWARRDDP